MPILASERGDEFPFVCAGGPCAFNPEPLADFVDFFVLGDGEDVINEILDLYVKEKLLGSTKDEILRKMSKIGGIYVPKLYKVDYNIDNTIKNFEPINVDIPAKIRKRVVLDLENADFPKNIVVPNIDVVHSRTMLELFRGCIHGCRFCQAGFIYRPVRERNVKTLIDTAKKIVKNTGYEEISLVSLSTSDFTGLQELTDKLTQHFEPMSVSISLPSLRVNSFSIDLMKKVQKVRKSGLTFAPEAGSQRLRDVINKGVTEQDLMSSVKIAFEGGWHSIKLYFMIGLPTENYEDIQAIADIVYQILNVYRELPYQYKTKKININLSTSSFVPKAFTPFQWDKQDSIEELRNKQKFLKDKLKNKSVKYNWHDSETSYLEALIARGDRRVGNVIKIALEKGWKFNS
jgi:radical SAM family uncharacterized protein